MHDLPVTLSSFGRLDSKPLGEVGDERVQRAQPSVVALGDVDVELLVHAITKLSRSIESRSSWSRKSTSCLTVRGIDLGRDLAQAAQDGVSDLVAWS